MTREVLKEKIVAEANQLTPENQVLGLRFVTLMADRAFAEAYERRLGPGQACLPPKESEQMMLEWMQRAAACHE